MQALFLLTVGSAEANDPAGDPMDNLVEVVQTRLGHEVDPDEVLRAAMGGVAQYLDTVLQTKGNEVLTTAEVAQLQSWNRGERFGVGVEFEIIAGRGLRLTHVFVGGPAQGLLQTGDVVIGIGGEPLTGRSPDAIHHMVRSAGGQHLVLDVVREGALRRERVVRGPYQLEPITVTEGTQPLEIRVHFFGRGAADALTQALGDSDKQGVVLDLRDNEGGLLSEMLACAGLFLPKDTPVVRHQGPDGTQGPSLSPGHAVPYVGALSLVVNKGTQGLTEAFVAAVQDHRRGVVVGMTTAGVASTPSFVSLGGDLVLKLHDRRILSPSGRDWSETGLEPDQMVEPPQYVLPGGPGWAPPDLQRDAARRLISTQSE